VIVKVAPKQLVAVAVGCAVIGSLLIILIGTAARGCRKGGRGESIEQRVARIEDILGLADAGSVASGETLPVAADGAVVSADDHSVGCAVAKVGAYKIWQDAHSTAKTSAGPAEGACADLWSDKKKQACYYAATAGVRTTLAARDAVIKGGTVAREAVKNVKDDPKNEAIARARAASEAAFSACPDDP
jgi:hypothetical protein